MTPHRYYIRWRSAQYLQDQCFERFGFGSGEALRAWIVAEHWRMRAESVKPRSPPPDILEAKLVDAEKAVKRDRPKSWEPEEWKG